MTLTIRSTPFLYAHQKVHLIERLRPIRYALLLLACVHNDLPFISLIGQLPYVCCTMHPYYSDITQRPNQWLLYVLQSHKKRARRVQSVSISVTPQSGLPRPSPDDGWRHRLYLCVSKRPFERRISTAQSVKPPSSNPQYSKILCRFNRHSLFKYGVPEDMRWRLFTHQPLLGNEEGKCCKQLENFFVS